MSEEVPLCRNTKHMRVTLFSEHVVRGVAVEDKLPFNPWAEEEKDVDKWFEEIRMTETGSGEPLYRWRIPLVKGKRHGRAILEEFNPTIRIVAFVHFEHNVPRGKTYYGSYTVIDDASSVAFLRLK